MKIGITQRLFLAILLATALAVAVLVIIMQWSLDRGFLRYVNTVEKTGLSRLAGKLEESYAGEGNWQFLRRDQVRWHRLVMASLPEDGPGPPGREPPGAPPGHLSGDSRPLPPKKPLPPHLAGSYARRLFLLDAGRNPVISHVEIPAGSETRPLRHQGKTVGYLGLLPNKKLSDERQLRFLKQQKNAFAMVAGVLVLSAAALSLILANRLVRPIRALTAATRRLAAGKFDTRVPSTASDELGQLARDFNSLALTLEMSEQARRQWIADISHELRTPLAILRGEIEAVQDGLRSAGPETVGSLHDEVMRLTRMVDDLHQLALSDVGALTYRKEELNPAIILAGEIDLLQPEFNRKGITLRRDFPGNEGFRVFADRSRLRQLFDNLLGNSLKYTNPPGELVVSLEICNGRVAINFQDSPPGVPEADLERIFDRLYRVEKSRSRTLGGAGLGLAICRNIVEAHEGSITALPSPLGGVLIRVELPLLGEMG